MPRVTPERKEPLAEERREARKPFKQHVAVERREGHRNPEKAARIGRARVKAARGG